jgi:hypothetical protein
MSVSRSALFLATTALLLAACGSSDSSDSSGSASPDGEVVAAGDAPAPGDSAGSIGDAIEVAAGAPAKADAAACAADREALELAVETYEVLNGTAPADQTALVTDQLIKEPSPRFDVADGAVVPSPGSPCT